MADDSWHTLMTNYTIYNVNKGMRWKEHGRVEDRKHGDGVIVNTRTCYKPILGLEKNKENVYSY